MNTLLQQAWVGRLGWTLVNSLWEGVLIGVIYGIARTSIGSRKAQSRYGLACAALLLVITTPVATFCLAGSAALNQDPLVDQLLNAQTPGSAHSASVMVLPGGPTSAERNQIIPWIVVAWLTGAIVLQVRLLGASLAAARMRSRFVGPAPAAWQTAVDQLGARVRVSGPVKLLVSAIVQVPTVIGWLRPVILVPTGALLGLPADHIEALLAHELAHIRRRDYLVNILQSIVEALLFYHPVTWWISGDIRRERESCCDDTAVAISGNTLTYVNALASLASSRSALCQSALAANGGLLTDRVARLLGASRKNTHFLPGPGIAAAAALLATACFLFGQAAAVRPSFEAASVKPNNEANPGFTFRTTPGRLTVIANPVMNLIVNAYGFAPNKIAGGPSWIASDHYDLEATAEGNVTRDKMMLMLQVLLEDRLKLKVHIEQREFPVFNLVIASGGPKIHKRTEQYCDDPTVGRPDDPRSNPCGTSVTLPKGTNMEWIFKNNDIPHLAKGLSRIAGRNVIDKTSFVGTFDFDVEFGQLDASNDTTVPSIFEVLSQFGLKLESAKGPVETLVIDHIERPSAN
jgi:uncharacterized protein (TIGR03435 family)